MDGKSIVLSSQLGAGKVTNSVCTSVAVQELEVEDCLLVNVKAKKVRPSPLAPPYVRARAGHTGPAPGRPGPPVRCCADTPDCLKPEYPVLPRHHIIESV